MNIEEAVKILEKNGYIVINESSEHIDNNIIKLRDADTFDKLEKRINRFKLELPDIFNKIQNNFDSRGDYMKNAKDIYYELSRLKYNIYSIQKICKEVNPDLA